MKIFATFIYNIEKEDYDVCRIGTNIDAFNEPFENILDEKESGVYYKELDDNSTIFMDLDPLWKPYHGEFLNNVYFEYHGIQNFKYNPIVEHILWFKENFYRYNIYYTYDKGELIACRKEKIERPWFYIDKGLEQVIY